MRLFLKVEHLQSRPAELVELDSSVGHRWFKTPAMVLMDAAKEKFPIDGKFLKVELMTPATVRTHQHHLCHHPATNHSQINSMLEKQQMHARPLPQRPHTQLTGGLPKY